MKWTFSEWNISSILEMSIARLHLCLTSLHRSCSGVSDVNRTKFQKAFLNFSENLSGKPTSQKSAKHFILDLISEFIIQNLESYWWIVWWRIVFMVWLTEEGRLAFFPAGTIVGDPHHRKSLTRHEQGSNLCRTWARP